MNEETYLETGRSRSEAVSAMVHVLMEEGYIIDNLSRKTGFVTTKPRFIPSSIAYYKIGHPPARLISDSLHKVNVSAEVTKTGGLKLKTEAIYFVGAEIFLKNPAFGSRNGAKEKVDTGCGIKLSKYYLERVKKLL